MSARRMISSSSHRLMDPDVKYPVIIEEKRILEPFRLVWALIAIPLSIPLGAFFGYLVKGIPFRTGLIYMAVSYLLIPVIMLVTGAKFLFWRSRIPAFVRRVRRFRPDAELVPARCMLTYSTLTTGMGFIGIRTRVEEPVVLVDTGDTIEMWKRQIKNGPAEIIPVNHGFYMVHAPGVGSNHVYQGIAVGSRTDGFADHAVIVRPFIRPTPRRSDYDRQVEDSTAALEKLGVNAKELRPGTVITHPVGSLVNLAITLTADWYPSSEDFLADERKNSPCDARWIMPDALWTPIAAWYPNGRDQEVQGTLRVTVIDTTLVEPKENMEAKHKYCSHSYTCNPRTAQFADLLSGYLQAIDNTVVRSNPSETQSVTADVVVRYYIPLGELDAITISPDARSLGFILEYQASSVDGSREFLNSVYSNYPRISNADIDLPKPVATNRFYTVHSVP